MAIDLGTTVSLLPSSQPQKIPINDLQNKVLTSPRNSAAQDAQVVLHSDQESEPAIVSIEIREDDPSLQRIRPSWARYVAGVITQVRPKVGYTGTVSSSVPLGAGLSSSAALEVALALALGFNGTTLDLALACQKAESIATGVPCGVMDQLTSVSGIEESALLIDFSTYKVSPMTVPDNAQILVVHSGESRALANSNYALRRLQCDAAKTVLGPLPKLSLDQVESTETFQLLSKVSSYPLNSSIGDVSRIFGLSSVNNSPTAERIAELLSPALLVKRIRHVVTECQRVYAFSSLLNSGDLREAGRIMYESHLSLAKDFEVSTKRLDGIVEELMGLKKGVYGARLTGAGFGGCVVALCEGRPPQVDTLGLRHWWVRPGRGAHLL